jgi:heat shock protein HslJ
MGCGAEINAVEDAYFDALRDVERQEVKDGRLVLTGPETELVFEPLAPVDPERLDGRTWTLQSWTVDGATRRARARPATLRFGRDGRVEARTRCRDLTGRYIVQGHEVVLTTAEMSRRDHAGCSRDAIEQEGAVVGALGDRFRVDVEGDRLRIESRDGNVLVLRAD